MVDKAEPADSIAEKTNTANPVASADALPQSRFELPWIILAALLLAIVLAAYQSHVRSQKEAQVRFGDIAAHASMRILDDVQHIESAMALGGAVIAASPKIDNTRWNAYLDAHVLRTKPVQGLVRMEYRAALVGQTMPTRAKSAVSNRSLPLSPPPLHVRNLETGVPLIERLASSALVDDAMGVARQSQKSALTTALIRDGAIAAEYVALVKPVYSPFRQSDDPLGYMIAVIRPLDLLAAAVDGSGQRLALAIAENKTTLFDFARSAAATTRLTTTLAIPVAQREWTLAATATPALADELSSKAPATILLVGILGTLSLAGLVWLLTRLRGQAAALAGSMTTKLRDQVKFTDDLIESNPSPIYRKDAHGRLVAVNRAWEQLHLHNRLDVIGKTSRDFQDALIADADEKFDADVLASAAGFEAREAGVIDAVGRVVPAIVAKQVIRRADGTADGIIGTITDVTLVKQLEREVARQREQLDLVIRSSQQGIFDVDFDAAGNQYYSERFREILGFGEDDFPPLFSWKDWVYPADKDLFHFHLVEHLKHRVPYFDVECRARRAGSGHMWLRVRGIAQYDGLDVARRFVGSIVDVTERREAELKLIEANIRVMEAARAKEAFLATMSHEIRTPMNGVLGMASLLTDTELNDEQRDYIRLIRASGDTLLRLIDDVLDFSKIESGHMTLESVSVELVSVVEETFELVAEKAREKRLELVWDLQDDLPDYFVGDATRFRQILLNLLTNAIKFTEKGEITLLMRGEKIAGGQLKLMASVHDSGIGIPPERVQQLFEPFTQVDASTTRKYGGTGLGLAIVKRLVLLMGGDVSLSSVEGEGSMFSFSIVTTRANGPPRPYLQRPMAEFSGVRLVLVESNVRRLRAEARGYQNWGFEVLCLSPTEVADRFNSARGQPVEILVTDTLLPSDGAAVLHAAIEAEDQRRLTAGAPRLAVVLMSALSRAELARLPAFRPLRHDMLVVRPAGRRRMYDVLRQAVRRQGNSDVATRPFTPTPVYEGDFPLRGTVNSTVVSTPGKMRPSIPPAVSAANAAGGQVNILVAEDNEVNQRVIEGMLRRLGHRVTIVADGQAAVEAMTGQKPQAENKYDIVLMDIHMPVLDGVAAMKAIKRMFDHAGVQVIPVVAMTAHALAGDREHYLNEGMDDYISKPIRRGELAALLLRAVPQKFVATVHPRPVPAAASPHDAVPVLDLEQLEDLRGLPDGAGNIAGSGANALIDLFKTKSAERMRVIAACLINSNWVLLGDTAHSLRGAAASVGFARVAAAGKELELAARRLVPTTAAAPAASTATAMTPMPTREQLDALYEQISGHLQVADAACARWLESTR